MAHTIVDMEMMEPPELSLGQPIVRSTPNNNLPIHYSGVSLDQPKKTSTIRLNAFDGMNIPLETHLAKLNNCSRYYNWTAADRVCHLKASLEGAAASLLWQLPVDCSEEQ